MNCNLFTTITDHGFLLQFLELYTLVCHDKIVRSQYFIID